MDISYPAETEMFRTEVKGFLAEALPSDWQGIGALDEESAWAFARDWRRLLAEHRYLSLAWPERYGGRGLSKLHQVVLMEELALAGVPFGLPQDTFGVKMLANTLLRWGTDEQRSHFLPRILSGEDTWCQGYSEPDAGSDLASLTTRAVRDGDEWVIDGQKVWTSGAHHSDWIFVLARTDRAATKHRGISFLLVPLDQPGVEVRPFRMMSGQLHFNEVFFNGARTRADLVVGGVDNGWTVAQSLLGVERGEEAATNPILFRAEVERLVELARLYGRDQDPVIRQRIAWCWSKVEIMRYLGYRILTGWLKGAEPGPESSIAKLYWSEYHTKVTDLAMDIMGLHGQVPVGRPPLRTYRTDDPGAANSSASWSTTYLIARSGTIYAGTSQVQRNILAEKVLGLPREPRATAG
ncbi:MULTISPECIES: acyl-CoA dehydrogenase family protein [unclassified Streptomyces]|uniref:acyl-CoA dehydrogenase family protein n=1 Tax=unclassified Streptomyces TaxID=2593676 RepID=UPI00190A2E26|nr:MULTISPECIES: acyl-CoA dehydrogenase family protein [unclassified Streptomyces]MBK3563266.1 acyl-CoA dehydrogenase family protein [Streptomyces sp. MBT62]MBK6012205.1 acyl-CoA dehydrogenase family protein [Streptomyces sp. MBT53]